MLFTPLLSPLYPRPAKTGQGVLFDGVRLSYEEVREASRSSHPDAIKKNLCFCRFNDAWKCACDQGLSSVSCHCDCHRKNRGFRSGSYVTPGQRLTGETSTQKHTPVLPATGGRS